LERLRDYRWCMITKTAHPDGSHPFTSALSSSSSSSSSSSYSYSYSYSPFSSSSSPLSS
jgi:hypothetical protein